MQCTILYGSECWVVDNKTEQNQNVSVAEMRMLRWMCGVAREDKTRNDFISGSVGVVPIVDKMKGNRLRWFDHEEKR